MKRTYIFELARCFHIDLYTVLASSLFSQHELGLMRYASVVLGTSWMKFLSKQGGMAWAIGPPDLETLTQFLQEDKTDQQ